jgi:hypothetical protein
LERGRAQGHLVESERPSRRFLEVLAALVTQRRVALLPRDASGAPGGVGFIGWADDEALYLHPEAAFAAVARFCREAGEPFPVRRERLSKDLAREGVSDCDPGRHTKIVKVAGRSKRVLCLRRDGVAMLLGEDFPETVSAVSVVTGNER